MHLWATEVQIQHRHQLLTSVMSQSLVQRTSFMSCPLMEQESCSEHALLIYSLFYRKLLESFTKERILWNVFSRLAPSSKIMKYDFSPSWNNLYTKHPVSGWTSHSLTHIVEKSQNVPHSNFSKPHIAFDLLAGGLRRLYSLVLSPTHTTVLHKEDPEQNCTGLGGHLAWPTLPGINPQSPTGTPPCLHTNPAHPWSPQW